MLLGIIIFIYGAAIGSFIAASVRRMENKKPIVFGRSECVSCGRRLGFFDLIPVFSFLFLRGKCRKCKQAIEFTDFLAEVACGALFAIAYFHNQGLPLIRDWIFLGVLVFLFLYDFKYRVLPDVVSIPSVIIVFALQLLTGRGILNLSIAVLAGGGFFLLQYLISRGKWIGGGDIRMGALLGAGLGWPGVAVAIFAAYILGGTVGAYLLLTKKKEMKSQIAFGTFLALGGAIALFWGEKIINWYIGL